MIFTADQIRAGDANLLRLATILDIADLAHAAAGKPLYDQRRIKHNCGSPACAAGHWRYANKRPMMPDFSLEGFERDQAWEVIEGQDFADFAISRAEHNRLFGYTGCGGARTAAEAAAFIRNFVHERSASISEVARLCEHDQS